MKKKVVQISFLFVAISFVAIGIVLEQYNGVILKAINICLECIGIG